MGFNTSRIIKVQQSKELCVKAYRNSFGLLSLVCLPSDFESVAEFLDEVIEALILDEEVRTFPEVMIPVFDILSSRIKDLELCQILLYAYLDILLYFTKQKDMAKVGLKVHMCSVELEAYASLS